jgi:hypothetical protein
MEKPNPEILRLSFSEGVRGYADALVVQAVTPCPPGVVVDRHANTEIHESMEEQQS